MAVATPCWPAPVSAMMRCFPSFCASSAWPMALLILCAPVWLRSSRFSQMRRAYFLDNRSAQVSGVGRPTKVRSSSWKRFWKALSFLALAYAAVISSRAGMRVSGT